MPRGRRSNAKRKESQSKIQNGSRRRWEEAEEGGESVSGRGAGGGEVGEEEVRWGRWARRGKPGSSSPARPTLSPAFPVWCGKDDKYVEYKYTNTKEVYRRSITPSAISQSVYPEPNLIIFSPCDKQSVILNSLN